MINVVRHLSVCLSACLPVFLVLVDNFIDVPICPTPRLLSHHLLRQDMDPYSDQSDSSLRLSSIQDD